MSPVARREGAGPGAEAGDQLGPPPVRLRVRFHAEVRGQVAEGKRGSHGQFLEGFPKVEGGGNGEDLDLLVGEGIDPRLVRDGGDVLRREGVPRPQHRVLP
jgi:hypothetical protein